MLRWELIFLRQITLGLSAITYELSIFNNKFVYASFLPWIRIYSHLTDGSHPHGGAVV